MAHGKALFVRHAFRADSDPFPIESYSCLSGCALVPRCLLAAELADELITVLGRSELDRGPTSDARRSAKWDGLMSVATAVECHKQSFCRRLPERELDLAIGKPSKRTAQSCVGSVSPAFEGIRSPNAYPPQRRAVRCSGRRRDNNCNAGEVRMSSRRSWAPFTPISASSGMMWGFRQDSATALTSVADFTSRSRLLRLYRRSAADRAAGQSEACRHA